MTWQFTYLYCLPFTLFLISSPLVVVNASEPPDSATVRRQILEVQERIESFESVFEIRIDPGEKYPDGYLLHRELTVKWPAYVIHLNAHGNPTEPWSEDLRKQRAVVTPDSVLVDWMLHRAHEKVSWDYAKETRLPGSLPLEAFFHSTGLWPLDRRLTIIAKNGVPYALSAVAEDDSYSMSEEVVESAEGQRLRVLLRKGLDKLYLDDSHHCALVARELYDARTGDCFERFELMGHIEVIPTVWLPKRVRHMRFATDIKDLDSRKAEVDFTYDILDWKVNEVSLRAFEFVNRPGELWLNPPEGTPRQVADGAAEYFDDVAVWLRRRGFSVKTKVEPTNWFDPVGVGLLAISIVVVVASWVMRRRRVRRNSGSISV